MDIAAWVREARKHRGLTQAQLGELVNVTKGNVSAWEKGHHQPSIEQALTIARETGWPLLPNDGPPGLTFFSSELLARLRMLSLSDVRRAENTIRAALDMPPLPRLEGPSGKRDGTAG